MIALIAPSPVPTFGQMLGLAPGLAIGRVLVLVLLAVWLSQLAAVPASFLRRVQRTMFHVEQCDRSREVARLSLYCLAPGRQLKRTPVQSAVCVVALTLV